MDYPNDFDLEMAANDKRKDPGDNIFIHGHRASIGCIPIGNINIEKLFTLIYCTGASNVRVIVSPFDMRKSQIKAGDLAGHPAWLKTKYERIKRAVMSLKIMK